MAPSQMSSSSPSGKQSRVSSLGGIDKNLKNRKVVAWLTNRPVEEEKYEREQFFKMLNQQIHSQQKAALEQQLVHSSVPAQNKQPPQQQEDIDGVSMLSQGLTTRSPQRDMNSTTMKDSALQMTQLNRLHPGEDVERDEQVNSAMQRTGAFQAAASGKKDASSKAATFEIVPIEFETATRLKLFLESLFQLKPNLLTSYALDKFRIVVEISQESNSERILKASAFNSLERMISQLNEFGCKVPVLVYAEIPLNNQQWN